MDLIAGSPDQLAEQRLTHSLGLKRLAGDQKCCRIIKIKNRADLGVNYEKDQQRNFQGL